MDKVRSGAGGMALEEDWGALRAFRTGAVSDTFPWGAHFQGAPENSAIKTIFSCDIFHVKINTKIHAKQTN